MCTLTCRPRRGLLACVASAALVACGAGAAEPTPPRNDTGTKGERANPVEKSSRHALLVGCTRYPNLAERFQLKGPANDVELLRRVLTERFGFPARNVVTLSEAAGGENRPTRSHIEREFRRLAQVARAGDQVFILLSGHGSQQPDQDPPQEDDPEPDGLDETFLPADVGEWQDGKKTVANAIVDDELRVWVRAIVDKGAAVFVVMDSCHSGTALRERETAEVPREVPAEVLVPQPAMAQARQRAEARFGKTRGADAADRGPLKLGKHGSLVALYAAQSFEPTVERPMPVDGADARPYGLLTYTLCQILTRSQRPLTHRELAERVQAQYVAWRRSSPTPVPEGDDAGLDREVFGVRAWPGRSRYTFRTGEGAGGTVNAGAIHGLTQGSVLAVYPPADRAADKPLGYARVLRCGPVESVVEPCAYNGSPAPEALPERGVCEPVLTDHGSMRLRVAVGSAPEADRRALREELRALRGEPDALVEPTDDPRRAEWLVHSLNGQTVLAPADALTPGEGPRRFLVPRENRAAALKEVLGRIGRGQNLLKVAASVGGEAARGPSELGVEVQVLKLPPKGDKTSAPQRIDGRGPLDPLHAGDRVAFRIANKGRVAVDVTLLFVDSGFGIEPVFPLRGNADNRFRLGESFQTRPSRVNAKTVGQEHLVVIAVEAAEAPVDFAFLSQPTLRLAEDTKTISVRGEDVLKTPLGQLFGRALYGAGDRRALEREEAEKAELSLLSWYVAPPAPKK